MCESIVCGQTTALDCSPSGFLSVMEELSRKTNRRESRRVNLATTATDTDVSKRIGNFAPYGKCEG